MLFFVQGMVNLAIKIDGIVQKHYLYCKVFKGITVYIGKDKLFYASDQFGKKFCKKLLRDQIEGRFSQQRR